VAMQAVVVFREEHPVYSCKTETLLAVLTLGSFFVGALALFIVINGFIEELNRPPRDRSTQPAADRE
jgi:hypothetical protein